MRLMVFDVFARTITNLPAEAILKELDLESKMLEHGSENYRLYLSADAYSIFCFRQFVRMTQLGKAMPNCKPLPPDQLKFYKETVDRLVQANELPQSALEKFESAFPASSALR